jgi:hypothetical protein
MRPYLLRALRVAALAGPLMALASADADQWSVEKAGFNLYRITGHGMPAGQDMFVRTEGCDDAPAAGVVDIRKDGATRRLTFNGSSVACDVRDFLVPAKVASGEYSVLLTQDQSRDWYRVTDGDMYLKTVGCITRTMSAPAVLDLNRDGTGWARLADGRRCAVEHAFRRFNP